MSTKKANTGRNIFCLVTGILVIIIGIIPIAGGAAILVFNRSADAEGYHWSNTYEAGTATYAFTMEIPSLSTVSLYARAGTALFGADNAVQVEWKIKPVDTPGDLFAGYTTAAEGNDYLAAMESEKAVWTIKGPFHPEISVSSLVISGEGMGEPEKSPFGENFWTEYCLGTGTASLRYQPVWDNTAANKCLVIMKNDRSRNVKADIMVGYYFPVFQWLPWRLIPLGALICLGGIYLVWQRHKPKLKGIT